MKKTYQEIDIKINVLFLEKQLRRSPKHLEVEIQRALRVNFNHANPEPMEVTEIETSMTNAHIRITTSVDWTLNEVAISNYIIKKVKSRLRIGVAEVELIFMREEAEIYAYNIKDFTKEVDKISQEKYALAYTSDNGDDCPVLKGAFDDKETPDEFVEWWANKYGLDQVI
jgi:hypothetical protein